MIKQFRIVNVKVTILSGIGKYQWVKFKLNEKIRFQKTRGRGDRIVKNFNVVTNQLWTSVF